MSSKHAIARIFTKEQFNLVISHLPKQNEMLQWFQCVLTCLSTPDTFKVLMAIILDPTMYTTCSSKKHMSELSMVYKPEPQKNLCSAVSYFCYEIETVSLLYKDSPAWHSVSTVRLGKHTFRVLTTTEINSWIALIQSSLLLVMVVWLKTHKSGLHLVRSPHSLRSHGRDDDFCSDAS